ncbi:MAG: response regulator [Candidatus Limnocylindria bacterium]
MPKTVLVVDDDEPTRGLLEMVLREGGYRVEQARDGLDALELVERARPDVIVLDRSLPRLGGTEFVHAYRARPGDHAPVVALCASVDAHGWAASIGAAASVGKPFGIEELLAAVATAIELTRTAPAREHAST